MSLYGKQHMHPTKSHPAAAMVAFFDRLIAQNIVRRQFERVFVMAILLLL